MSAIAVVILNYNGGELVRACLDSVRVENPTEIVVVDNASTDGSADEIAERFRDVTLIRNVRNTGFATAANQGIRATTGRYVFLLNQDATIVPGSLAAMVRLLDDHPEVAAAGALVRNPDGSVQPTKRAFPTIGAAMLHGIVGIFRPDNPGTRSYVLVDERFDEPRRVDWVACTATALRRDSFEAVGGFDESYFFFVEDVDLCKRLSLAGFQVWFHPGAEVVHRWGGSWTKRPLKFLWLHQWNLLRYVRKYYKGTWVLAYPFIAAGLLVRFMLLAVRWLITKRSVPEHRSIP